MKDKMINILPDHIANKIAAGEVVQRPESVLKELLENSIDANARNIDVIIRDAGKTHIQVVDDGDGMSESDVVTSIERHATSKIVSVEDLEAIRTFGFRGEALSSISSVSKIEIKTERYSDELGTCLKFDEENGVVIEKGSYSKGTSVSVKNLFYNTPARRNFLKSNTTELKHLVETFKKTALSHPQIGFKFWNNDELIYDFLPANLDERIEKIFKKDIFDSLVEVNENTEFLSVNGFVAKPTYLRKSKGEQYLFINSRYVSSKVINHAVYSAYENILDKGEYPFFVLFLDLDPAEIDINVHPSKLEVKFEDEKGIYTFVKAVIKKSLGRYDLVPNIQFAEANSSDGEKLSHTYKGSSKKNDFSDRPNKNVFPNLERDKKSIFSENDINLLFESLNEDLNIKSPDGEVEHPFDTSKTKEVYHEGTEQKETKKAKSNDSSFIVSLHNKYILSQIKSGLMLIDQHVAHERILYEKAINSFGMNMPFSQQLLFEQAVRLDPADIELIKEIGPYLMQLGFEIKLSGKKNVIITGVPSDVKIGSEADILMEIINQYREYEIEQMPDITDRLAKAYACKAAIKAGDKLSDNEMRILVDQLFATSMPYVCPHGRPIIIKISLDELDKKFGR